MRQRTRRVAWVRYSGPRVAVEPAVHEPGFRRVGQRGATNRKGRKSGGFRFADLPEEEPNPPVSPLSGVFYDQ